MADTKKIDRDMHLKLLALYTMAANHYAELRKYERLLGTELGIGDEYGNARRMSDSIYQEEPFDLALKNSDIEVEDAPQQ